MGINRRQFLFNEIVRADPTKNSEDIFNGDIEETYWSLVNTGAIGNSSSGFTSRYGRKNKVGFIGDSITAAKNGQYYPGGYVWGLGEGPAVSAMLQSDGRWDLITNAGVGGQTSTQIAARVQNDIINTGCNVCVISSCYMNDIGQGLTVDQTMSNIVSMVTQLRLAGIVPVLCTPTPYADSGATTAILTQLSQTGMRVRKYAIDEGIVLVDLTTPIMDPATGLILSTYNQDNSVHPNAAGYNLLGAAVQKVLDSILTPVPNQLIQHQADPTDLLSGQGMFMSNTSGVGTGWSTTSSSTGGTFTITTDSAVQGSLQRITANATTGNMILDKQVIGFSIGDLLCIRGIVTNSGAATPIIRFVINGNTPNPGAYPVLTLQSSVTRGKFVLFHQVAVGTTSIYMRLQQNALAGSGYFEVGQLSVKNLTANKVSL